MRFLVKRQVTTVPIEFEFRLLRLLIEVTTIFDWSYYTPNFLYIKLLRSVKFACNKLLQSNVNYFLIYDSIIPVLNLKFILYL